MSTPEQRGRPRKADVLSASARIYIGALVVALLGLIPLATRVDPLPPASWVPVTILSLLSVISSTWGNQSLGANFHFNFGGIVLLAALALTGPVGACIVGASAYLFEIGRRPVSVRIFNTSMCAVTAVLAGLLYVLVGGVTYPGALQHTDRPPHTPWAIIQHIALPLLVADIAACVLNVALLGIIIALTSDATSWRRFVVGQLTSSGAPYIGFGMIGFLLVVLWWPAEVGPFSAVLILAPLFVANYAFRQYSEEHQAHERTIRALVAAVEVRDHFTRGHSERVARICGLVADSIDLTDREVQALRYAALLHDIGKLAVPMHVLRQPGVPGVGDLALITLHPRRGVDMLADIEFLQASLPGIEHHHERMDGRGYPDGLSGQDIPLFARIIAVADAFDSLTTQKVDRPAASADRALVELYRRAGDHLDPSLVVALERALARHEWRPTTLDAQVLATAGRAFDHDDPAASELMAGQATRVQSPRGVPEAVTQAVTKAVSHASG